MLPKALHRGAPCTPACLQPARNLLCRPHSPEPEGGDERGGTDPACVSQKARARPPLPPGPNPPSARGMLAPEGQDK